MDNTLRKVETEGIVFYIENTFGDIDSEKYMTVFHRMQSDGIILSKYEDNLWIGYSDVKKYGLQFDFDEISYMTHFYLFEEIPTHKMRTILKCYAIYQAGSYILPNIRDRVRSVCDFITHVGDAGYAVTQTEETTILGFLGFIGVSECKAEKMMGIVHMRKEVTSRQRVLAPLINYIAVAEEINEMYVSGISDDEFIRWFPIYFWANVTFVIPLRATEMILTPYGCIVEKDGEYHISLRRTLLKGRGGGKTVHYKVDKDYGMFEYQIPDTLVLRNILKYERLTAEVPRRFLFLPSRYSVRNMYTLPKFNKLLEDFIKTRLIGNRKYDYARFACGIKDFEIITAGDSRPIAMANLYFQGAGADVCRQLANHVHASTSAGYYTNVSNTVYASSVMQLQRKLNAGYMETEFFERAYSMGNALTTGGSAARHGCMSPRLPHETSDISDCIAEEHIHECLGCRYFRPSTEQLEKALTERRAKLDEASREVVRYMEGKDKIKTREADFDRIFNDAHTGIVRFRTACNVKAGKELEKWHRKRAIPKT